MKNNKKEDDIFARIAMQRTADQANLIEPQPPALSDIEVPAKESDASAAFRPLPKIDTAEKLQVELVKQRKRFAPFMQNFAPTTKSERIIVEVEEFDWRMETDADNQDFIATLQGSGEWQQVHIPHYGGPVGRAVSYYRTTFHLTVEMLQKGALFACFKGVDYKAHVFINGMFIGSHEGFFAPFEFDFTSVAREGENTLVVKVENDAVPISGDGSWGMSIDGDKLYAATGPGWDDAELGWHHCPPGMGIYQPVSIEARPIVHIADIFVRPLTAEKAIEVWVEVYNTAITEQPVEFKVSVFGQNFSAKICREKVIKPLTKAGPKINCFRFSIAIPKPRIWDLDTPWLYQIQIVLDNSDTLTRQFGMRSFTMETENKPYGRFHLNNREIRLRGANTMGFEQQDVIKGDFDQLCDDILLAKICNMNFLRLTQRPVQSEIYEMCDKLGLMTQTDLSLFGFLPRKQFCEAVRQAEEMERLVRSHPCNIMVSYINEPFPHSWGSKEHRQCTRIELENFFKAADQVVKMANPDRVIKAVDGDYDPPGPGLPDNHCYCCWYNGHGVDIGKLHEGYWQRVKPDWMYGCGEFGAEGLDPVNIMRKYYPAEWLPKTKEEELTWSPNRIKDAQTGKFHYMFFDTQKNVADWASVSQQHQAWATRIMTEAFRRDSRMNSIAIHLFIDAWPSGWMKSIMDVERHPKPAFFEYREALTPLMANIRTDRHAYKSGDDMQFEFWICNDTRNIPNDARLRYQFEINGKVIFAQQTIANIEKCKSSFQGLFEYMAPDVLKRTSGILRLALALPDGRILHDTSVNVDIFPKIKMLSKANTAVIIGKKDGKAYQLAQQLGLRRVKYGSLYLIDDMTIFARRRDEIEKAAQNGATVVFLELPVGIYEIGQSKINVDACGMGSRHFVSRNTGHSIVADFKPDDFKMWYNSGESCITPLLNSTFSANGWTPILTSGNSGWGGGEWEPVMAAAEQHVGKGVYRLCQVTLAGRVDDNPIAGIFARRLLNL